MSSIVPSNQDPADTLPSNSDLTAGQVTGSQPEQQQQQRKRGFITVPDRAGQNVEIFATKQEFQTIPCLVNNQTFIPEVVAAIKQDNAPATVTKITTSLYHLLQVIAEQLYCSETIPENEQGLDILCPNFLSYLKHRLLARCGLPTRHCTSKIPGWSEQIHSPMVENAISYLIKMIPELAARETRLTERDLRGLGPILADAFTQMETSCKNTILAKVPRFAELYVQIQYPLALTCTFKPFPKKSGQALPEEDENEAEELEPTQEEIGALDEEEVKEKLRERSGRNTKKFIHQTLYNVKQYKGTDLQSEPGRSLHNFWHDFLHQVNFKLPYHSLSNIQVLQLLRSMYRYQRILHVQQQQQSPPTVIPGPSAVMVPTNWESWESERYTVDDLFLHRSRGYEMPTWESLNIQAILAMSTGATILSRTTAPEYPFMTPTELALYATANPLVFRMFQMMSRHLTLSVTKFVLPPPTFPAFQFLHYCLYQNVYPPEEYQGEWSNLATAFQRNFLRRVNVLDQNECKTFLLSMFSRVVHLEMLGYDMNEALEPCQAPRQRVNPESATRRRARRNGKTRRNNWKRSQRARKQQKKKEKRDKRKERKRQRSPQAQQDVQVGSTTPSPTTIPAIVRRRLKSKKKRDKRRERKRQERAQQALRVVEASTTPTATTTMTTTEPNPSVDNTQQQAQQDGEVGAITPTTLSTTTIGKKRQKRKEQRKKRQERKRQLAQQAQQDVEVSMTTNVTATNHSPPASNSGTIRQTDSLTFLKTPSPPSQEKRQQWRAIAKERRKLNKSRGKEARAAKPCKSKAEMEQELREHHVKNILSLAPILPLPSGSQVSHIRIARLNLDDYLNRPVFSDIRQKLRERMEEIATQSQPPPSDHALPDLCEYWQKYPRTGNMYPSNTDTPTRNYYVNLLWRAILKSPPRVYETANHRFGYSMTLDGYAVNFQMVKVPLAEEDRIQEQAMKKHRHENTAGVFQPYPSIDQLQGFAHVVALDFNRSGVVASHWDANQENPDTVGGRYTRVTSAHYQDLSQINKHRFEDAKFRQSHEEYRNACEGIRKSHFVSLSTTMAALGANHAPVRTLLNIDSSTTHRRGWAFKLQVYKPRAIRKLVIQNLVGEHASKEKTLVLQGNWNGVQTGLKGGMHFPIKQFNKELNRVAYVVSADEYRTSKMDSQSGNTPRELKQLMHWVTRGEDQQRKKVVLWRVKRSPNSLKTWNRDKNAADNILQLYPGIKRAILNGQDPKDDQFRPLHLQRAWAKQDRAAKAAVKQGAKQAKESAKAKKAEEATKRRTAKTAVEKKAAKKPPVSKSVQASASTVPVVKRVAFVSIEEDDDDFESD